MKTTIVAKELTKVARLLVGDMEGPPEFQDMDSEGHAVQGRDRFRVHATSGWGMMGRASPFYIKVFNPNRGETGFAIEDEASVDKLESSLHSALEKVRVAMREHQKVVREFYKKQEEEHLKRKENQK